VIFSADHQGRLFSREENKKARAPAFEYNSALVYVLALTTCPPFVAGSGIADPSRSTRDSSHKSFLLLFYKKEGLPSAYGNSTVFRHTPCRHLRHAAHPHTPQNLTKT
jgi:hypothetical protein